MAQWHHVTSEILFSLGSGNGLLPEGTKPLPEPTVASHLWGSVAFTWEQFRCEFPGANDLMKMTEVIEFLFLGETGQSEIHPQSLVWWPLGPADRWTRTGQDSGTIDQWAVWPSEWQLPSGGLGLLAEIQWGSAAVGGNDREKTGENSTGSSEYWLKLGSHNFHVLLLWDTLKPLI